MIRLLMIGFWICLATAAAGIERAQSAGPYDEFIPDGFELLASAEGDLNRDAFENDTVFGSRSGGSTAEFRGEQITARDAWDAELNRTYEKRMGSLDEEQKQAFRESQRKWIAYFAMPRSRRSQRSTPGAARPAGSLPAIRGSD